MAMFPQLPRGFSAQIGSSMAMFPRKAFNGGSKSCNPWLDPTRLATIKGGGGNLSRCAL